MEFCEKGLSLQKECFNLIKKGPYMAEITLSISDVSLLDDIKQAVKMIRGVDSVTVKKTPEMTAYERSKADIKAGRVFSYDSLDDLIKEMAE